MPTNKLLLSRECSTTTTPVNSDEKLSLSTYIRATLKCLSVPSPWNKKLYINSISNGKIEIVFRLNILVHVIPYVP